MGRKIKPPSFSYTAEQLAYFRRMGAAGGTKSSGRMTPAERSARAKKAVAARQAKARAKEQ